MSTIDHAARLAQHDAAIEKLEKGQALIFSKLDAIASAVHELRASTGPAFKDILDIATRCVMIFAALAGGIIYLARGGSTEALHAIDKRIEKLEMMLPRRPPVGFWVPHAPPAAQ